MILTDREILELNELCDAMIEGSITNAQFERLERLISASDEARQYYVRAMDLSASLGRYASEMQMGPADNVGGWTPRITSLSTGSRIANVGRLAVAASILFAIAMWLTNRPEAGPELATKQTARIVSAEYVARITGAMNCQWKQEGTQLAPGTFLHRGQRLELVAGFVEITFDSGAVALLEGPAVLEINSAWDSTLRHGALTADVPPQAIGFRVLNRAVEVVDLGTSFSMVADGAGAAEVFVLEGEVEAMPRGPESETILLRTNESRRFARANITVLENSEQMIKRFSEPVPLERREKTFGYVRWSFDKSQGRMFPAEAVGVKFGAERANLRLQASSPRARDDVHVQGLHGGALEFDGDLVSRAKVPGLSGNAPRTIAFWLKTPENAQLSNAYSMVAWRADSTKLGSRPVHVSWNRNPAEGPLGAVRTDFSGGHAMGTTPLRDGRWHHVAVIFQPGDDPEAPVQVKQYVDGRLESNTVTPGEKRSIAAKVKVDGSPDSNDWLYLGCRLGANGPRKERFRGQIDELVVADRSLEPSEVVQLMDVTTIKR